MSIVDDAAADAAPALPQPQTAFRLGMLTPSSNTVLEPTAAAILSGLPNVTCHFARFRVTRISLEPADLGQFEQQPILAAADLLADARVHLIAWTGTSGSWLGERVDADLCAAILAQTGVPATTSTLAIKAALDLWEARRIALVTPYVDDVQGRIIEQYRRMGIACVAERHLDDHGNYSFADWPEDVVADMIRDTAATRPDAVVVMCTNFRGASVVERVEREIGIPVFDSISAVIWQALTRFGSPPASVRGWGRLFGRVR